MRAKINNQGHCTVDELLASFNPANTTAAWSPQRTNERTIMNHFSLSLSLSLSLVITHATSARGDGESFFRMITLVPLRRVSLLLLSDVVELPTRRERLDDDLHDQIRPIDVQHVQKYEQAVEDRDVRVNLHGATQS